MKSFAQEVRKIYHQQRKISELLDPVSFAESATGLNIKLYPAQRFILKLFYKLPLESYLTQPIVIKDEFNEHTLNTFHSEIDFFNFLHSERRVNMSYDDWVNSDENLYEIIFVCGRRASKTTLTSIITIHQLYVLLSLDNPHDHFGVMRSDPISICLVSNKEDGAIRTYQAISDLVTNSKFFQRYVAYQSAQSGLWLATESFKQEKEDGVAHTKPGNINIRSFAAGPSVRGASNIVTVMDEIDHFRDASSKRLSPELAHKVYEALTPSILGFVDPDTGKGVGKSFIMSSPNGKRGVLHDFYEKSFKSKNKLMLHTPSNWINNRIAPDILKALHAQSETMFRQEIRAEFIDPISNWISNIDRLVACFNKAIPNHPYQTQDTHHFLSLDLAFSNDRTVIAVGHIQYEKPELNLERPELNNLIAEDGPYYIIDHIDVMVPEEGNTLSVWEIIEKLKKLYLRFNIRAGSYDQFSGEIFSQLIEREPTINMNKEPATQYNNSDRAMTMKRLILDGRLLMPYIPLVKEEFMGLQETVLKDGLVRVANDIFHDDSYSAVSRVIELCFRHKEIISPRYTASKLTKTHHTYNPNSQTAIRPQSSLGTGNSTRDYKLAGLARGR